MFRSFRSVSIPQLFGIPEYVSQKPGKTLHGLYLAAATPPDADFKISKCPTLPKY
jgi:hypothetical protein